MYQMERRCLQSVNELMELISEHNEALSFDALSEYICWEDVYGTSQDPRCYQTQRSEMVQFWMQGFVK